MKKLIIFLSIFFVLTACSKLEDLNFNTKGFTTVPGQALFNGQVRVLFNQLGTFNVNQNNTELFVQHFAETTYPDESQYDMVTRPVPATHMNLMYRQVLMNLKEAKRLLTAAPLGGILQAQRDNQLAIIEILAVYAWSNVIETYGGMPYSEALDYTKPTPKYDDGMTVYKNLISRLDAALATMTSTAGGMGAGYDNIYGGGVAGTPKWMRFANSLKLRMGMMLADADPAYSKTVVNSAVAGAFIAGDKFSLTYLGSSPNQNPIYTELVVSGRFDFVVTSELVDRCNALNDPRRVGFMWTQVGGVYKGGAQGMSNAYTSFTHVDNAQLKSERELVLMDYAEVQFLLAEAAARTGYAGVTSTPDVYYNNAITASITSWGGTAAQAVAYLAQPAVAYATATGTWQQKIGTQAWFAYYMRGFSAWTTWIRLDYPRLKASPKHVQDVNGIPLRYTYATSEQTLNAANYALAATAIGGDNAMTPLFWDLVHYDTLTGL